jgi:hypothetical protein
MASPGSETFNYAYQVTGNIVDGFQLDNLSSQSPNFVVPAAGTVSIEEPNGGAAVYGEGIDVTGEGINTYQDASLTNLFPESSDYVFVVAANVEDNGNTLNGIIIQNTSNNDYFFLTGNQYTGALGNGNGSITPTSAESAICFMAGTLIRTPNGEVAVESLKRGDLVSTQDGNAVPVDWLGIQTVALQFADKMRVLPIRIRAGALAENVPSRDLLLSPDHAVLVDGALIHAGALVNGTSVVREDRVPLTFTYYHVEVADHSLIIAENTPAETFVDNVDRLNFDNWAEHEALYPNGKQVSELPYPRAKSHRQVPARTRVMLAARAAGTEAPAALVV